MSKSVAKNEGYGFRKATSFIILGGDHFDNKFIGLLKVIYYNYIFKF